jgi:hypothetical protein
MKGIIGVLIVTYLLCVTPLLFGLLWNRIFRDHRYELSDVYVKGYFLMFAAFWCAAQVCILRERWLSTLGKYWILAVTAVNVVSMVVSARTLPEYIRRWGSSMKKSKGLRCAVIASVLLIVVSIVFLKPIQDDVVEYALTAVNTNTLYVYHPFTAEAHPDQMGNQRLAPLAMLYAAASWASGLSPATVIKVVAPVFLLLFFCSSVWQIGRMLFAERQERIPVFFFMIILISSYPVYSAVDYLEAAILLNCWNGATLLNCVILPYLVIYGWKHGNTKWITKVTFWAVSVLAAQLTYVRGAYYVTLITVIWLLIEIGRKGYNYVNAHKRD